MIPRDLVLQPESRHPLVLPPTTVESVLQRAVPDYSNSFNPAHSNPPAIESSIIVVSFNNLVFTRLCLESVLLNTSDPGFELIVVDNGSTDGSSEYLLELSRLYESIRVLFNNENLGFARACNQGLSLARNDILVLLNNDTIVPPGWLAGLVRGLQEPNVGMVGPVTNRCGNEAEVTVSYETYGGMLDYADQRSMEYTGQTASLRMLTMFCVAFTRKIHEQIGHIDESFEIGFFEDEDYSMRLAQAGYTLICMEDVFVHHFGQASFGKLASSGEYGQLFHANRRRFEEKWDVKWRPHVYRERDSYKQLVLNICDLVETSLPFKSIVLVASKGDEDLVTFTGRTGWHFPQEQHGTYSGHHPANCLAAIREIDQHREKGAQFLVLPSPMFWWLQFYSDLATHLAEHYSLLVDDEQCLIFSLGQMPEDCDHSVCGPDISEHSGLSHLTRKLVTIVYLHTAADNRAANFLEALARRQMPPHRLLIVDNSQGDDLFPEGLAACHDHVALVKTDHRVELAEAAQLGCILAPGDVVLCGNPEKLKVSTLEKLCSYASDDRLLASASDEEAMFITRRALRQVGFGEPSPSDSWIELKMSFCQRAESLGFNNYKYEPVPRSRGHVPVESIPVVLALVHSGKGGARFSVEDILKGLSASSRCLLLETAKDAWFLFEIFQKQSRLIRHDRFSEAWSAESGLDKERLMAFARIIDAFSVSIVNIHHLMGSGPEVIDLLAEAGIPAIFSFHDQYVICPTAHLVDDKGKFCGGVCTNGAGNCGLNPLYFNNMVSELKHVFVHTHRSRMTAALKKCQAFIVPSEITKDRLIQAFDFLAFRQIEVVEHGQDLQVGQAVVRPVPDEPARVVVLGSINVQKGADLIMALARLNYQQERRFEFHFLGNRPPSFAPETFGGVYHGSYSRGGLQSMLERIRPSFSILAPICEETFSYTLSESWASGIPVFASNRGALRERVTKHGGGWLFDPENVKSFFAGMNKVLDDPAEWDAQTKLIKKIPLIGLEQECRQMRRIFDRFLETTIPNE